MLDNVEMFNVYQYVLNKPIQIIFKFGNVLKKLTADICNLKKNPQKFYK